MQETNEELTWRKRVKFEERRGNIVAETQRTRKESRYQRCSIVSVHVCGMPGKAHPQTQKGD